MFHDLPLTSKVGKKALAVHLYKVSYLIYPSNVLYLLIYSCNHRSELGLWLCPTVEVNADEDQAPGRRVVVLIT